MYQQWWIIPYRY